MNSQQRKIVVLGNEGVGKTSLVSKFLGLYDFSEEYKPTTTSDFFSKTVVHEEREISASIWDIGGSAKIGRSFMRGTHGVMLVVDLAKGKRLLEGLDNKYEEVVKLAGIGSNNPFPCHILANKSDLVTDANDLADAKEVLDKWCARCSARPITYTIVSAKSPGDVVVESSFTALLALTEEGSNNNNNNNKSSSGGAALNGGPQSYVDSNLDSTINFSNLLQADDDNTEGKEEPMAPVATSSSSSDGPKVIEAKVVIAGAPAVGKTSILKRFTQDGDAINEEKMGKYEPTLGADFRLVAVPARDKTLKMQIWDTAGDKKMIALGKSIYKNADYLILVYDMTSAESFQALDLYYNNFVLYGNAADPDAFPCLLVGNKCDTGERATTLEDVLKWCAAKRPKRPITHIECSALRSIAVNDIFIIVADAIADYEDYLDGEGSDSDGCSSTANRCFRDFDETGSQLSLHHHNMGQTPVAINEEEPKSCIAELKDEIAGGKFCTIV
jgi:small GTP-binding protein